MLGSPAAYRARLRRPQTKSPDGVNVMGDVAKKILRLNKGVEGSHSSAGLLRAAAEGQVETSPEKAGEEYGWTLTLLARTERLLTLRAEHARVAAARLTDAQNELVRRVGEVRDFALTAAALADKIPSDPPVWKSDLPFAARGTILLASILRHIREVSNTAATTVESQSATIGELAKATGEAAKGTLHLARKVYVLAEEAQAVLPLLSSNHLVEVELQCLTDELEKVLTEFRGPQAVAKAGIEAAKPQLPAKPLATN